MLLFLSEAFGDLGGSGTRRPVRVPPLLFSPLIS